MHMTAAAGSVGACFRYCPREVPWGPHTDTHAYQRMYENACLKGPDSTYDNTRIRMNEP